MISIHCWHISDDIWSHIGTLAVILMMGVLGVPVRPAVLEGSTNWSSRADSESSHIFVHEKLMVDRLDDRLSANFANSRLVYLEGGPCGVGTGGRSAQWKVGIILTV
jgi:hypothetical protein